LRNLTKINQAISVLIADGETPQAARHHLHRDATFSNISLNGAAERLLANYQRATRELALRPTTLPTLVGVEPAVSPAPRQVQARWHQVEDVGRLVGPRAHRPAR
jgi:hypothetical protein